MFSLINILILLEYIVVLFKFERLFLDLGSETIQSYSPPGQAAGALITVSKPHYTWHTPLFKLQGLYALETIVTSKIKKLTTGIYNVICNKY
jgi:hypothetical protein